MSKIYTKSHVVCSCDTGNISNTNSDDSSIRDHLFDTGSFRIHELVELFFCYECVSLKCTACCIGKLESKFCPNCMTDQTESTSTYCTKNCFNCPQCSSVLSISTKSIMIDASDDDNNDEEDNNNKMGKIFKFKCQFCDYHYTTNTIEKPRSLIKILESEDRKFSDYQSLLQKYKDSQSLTNLKTSNANTKLLPSQTKRLSGDFLAKLTELNLANLTKRFSKDISEIELLQERISKVTKRYLEDELDPDETSRLSFQSLQQKYSNSFSQILPNPTKLIPKKSYKCGHCQTDLIMPDPSPISLKFSVKSNAVEIVPSIRLSKSDDDTLYKINIINPYPAEVKIQMSSLSEIPRQFNPMRSHIMVELPHKEFEIGPKKDLRKEQLLKSIPTPYLTEFTAASRTEKFLRIQPPVTNPDQSFDAENEFIEFSENWASVPMKLSIDKGIIPQNLQIPLHLSVSYQNAQGSKHKYSFWSILQL